MNNSNFPMIVSSFYKIKNEFPQLRIGQILVGFSTWCFNCGIDAFYMDDKEFETKLQEYYKILKSKNERVD